MSGGAKNRPMVSEAQTQIIMQLLAETLASRLAVKGRGSFSSTHEILGIIEEERLEFLEAIHAEDMDGAFDELMDIAVTAVFGLACLDAKTVDW